MRFFFTLMMVVIVVLGLQAVEAQVRTSSNFQIQSDSINIGGEQGTSTNFIQESTVGEVATGVGTSTNYQLRAGYQQMQEVFLALSGGENISMTSAIPGVTGGEANGSTTLTATTDGPSGYQLTIAAETEPAMRFGTHVIQDYQPVGGFPDVAFVINAGTSSFGFSPFGVDVVEQFQTNGTVCGVAGSASATACWDGLSGSAVVIAERNSPNQPAGSETTVYYKVGVGNGTNQPPGTYTATTTITLLSL